MGCIGILLAILGIVGYANEIWWLFYLAGGIATVFDVLALISGELRCLGTIVTVAFWFYGYQLTSSFWDGLMLGSCMSTVVMVVASFAFMLFSTGLSAAISGLTSVIDWIKNSKK